VRRCRNDDIDRPDLLGDALHGALKGLGQALDFTAPASRQHQKKRRRRIAALFFSSARPQLAHLFDQRMTDIGAWRAAEFLVRARLERKQRQDVIDISAHGPRASRPPGPHRRRNVVHDWDRRVGAAHATRDAMGKIRAVNDHHHIRPRGNCRTPGLPDPFDDHGQPRRDRRDADNGEFIDPKQRR
jgi:hypothetical protein